MSRKVGKMEIAENLTVWKGRYITYLGFRDPLSKPEEARRPQHQQRITQLHLGETDLDLLVLVLKESASECFAWDCLAEHWLKLINRSIPIFELGIKSLHFHHLISIVIII